MGDGGSKALERKRLAAAEKPAPATSAPKPLNLFGLLLITKRQAPQKLKDCLKVKGKIK